MPRRDSDIDSVFVESFMEKTAVLYGEDSSLCGVFSESLIHIVALSCHYCDNCRAKLSDFSATNMQLFFSLWIEEAALERS